MLIPKEYPGLNATQFDFESVVVKGSFAMKGNSFGSWMVGNLESWEDISKIEAEVDASRDKRGRN